jgi:hypothetical protein
MQVAGRALLGGYEFARRAPHTYSSIGRGLHTAAAAPAAAPAAAGVLSGVSGMRAHAAWWETTWQLFR